MDPRLRRYYEALVRHNRRDDDAVNDSSRSDVNALMYIFAIIIVLMAGVFFFCLVLFFDPAAAHDAARPDLNDWFDRLSAGRGPCCADRDGLSLSDPDWDSKGGHYRVRIEGNWIAVPDDVVIKKPNLDGRTMVWPMLINGETNIRCFMPGVMG